MIKWKRMTGAQTSRFWFFECFSSTRAITASDSGHFMSDRTSSMGGTVVRSNACIYRYTMSLLGAMNGSVRGCCEMKLETADELTFWLLEWLRAMYKLPALPNKPAINSSFWKGKSKVDKMGGDWSIGGSSSLVASADGFCESGMGVADWSTSSGKEAAPSFSTAPDTVPVNLEVISSVSELEPSRLNNRSGWKVLTSGDGWIVGLLASQHSCWPKTPTNPPSSVHIRIDPSTDAVRMKRKDFSNASMLVIGDAWACQHRPSETWLSPRMNTVIFPEEPP